MTRLAAIPVPRAHAAPMAEQAAHEGQPHPVLGLLAAGIPLTLLIDLMDPHGPDSRAIIMDERRQARRAATA